MPLTVNFAFPRTTRRAQPRRLLRISDGDTPVIDQPIRMVSCDTPEKAHYAGKPEISQPKLDSCRERLQSGFYPNVDPAFRDYLLSKLTPDAAERHTSAGIRATQVFDEILDRRLTRPDGLVRRVATIPTGEIIDPYGRLLAYIAPWFSGPPNDPVPLPDHPDRRTFNLDMIESGWAAFFPIYPSLPRNDDLNRALAAAETAWNENRGIWKEFGDDVLLAYEYRLCIKLGTADTAAKGMARGFQRICIDLRDSSEKGLFGWHAVPPPFRLWVWADQIGEARAALGLTNP